MILQELKEDEALTESEKAVVKYIRKYPEKVLKMTSRELAEKIFVSAPTVIRFCKKLGYESFSEFKIELSKETTDEYQKMLNVDLNFPFSKENTTEEMVNRLSTIAISNMMKLRDTFDFKALNKICNLIAPCHFIDIYGVGLSVKSASEFREKMMHIGYHAMLVDENAQTSFWTNNSTENQCAIIISYSGKTIEMVNAIRVLKKRGTKTVLITGNKQSDMVQYANAVYFIQSDEKLEMKNKLNSFGVLYNIHYILDCIYAGVFMKDYDRNLELTKHYGDFQFKIRDEDNAKNSMRTK